MTDDEKRLFERSVIALEKLANETARLRGDVVRLAGRIVPFEGEKDHEFPGYYSDKSPKNFREVLDVFNGVRRQVLHCEGTLNRVSAYIDQIRNDSWSRQDMKPWIK